MARRLPAPRARARLSHRADAPRTGLSEEHCARRHYRALFRLGAQLLCTFLCICTAALGTLNQMEFSGDALSSRRHRIQFT